MESQLEIQKLFNNRREKFNYYIIALCATSIGFSVYITLGRSLNYSQIPLGFSILSWSISIFYGLKVLKTEMDILFLNHGLLKVQSGMEPLTGTNPNLIQMGSEYFLSNINAISKKAGNNSRYQEILFYIGMISFIIWHILEMYLAI